MKQILKFFLFFSAIVCSCSNSNISESIEQSSPNKIDLSSYYIDLDDMYNIDKENYAIYFSSSFCPACNSLNESLINFINNPERCIKNFYIVDLTYIEEEKINQMPSGNAMFDEDIINNSLYATSLEQTYFKSAPSLYFVSEIDEQRKLTNLILNYQLIKNVFDNNIVE